MDTGQTCHGHGLPLGVYFDNGSEFLTHDIAGRGHRKKADRNTGDDPPTIFSLLGITMTNALVKNAKAKNIERYFYTFKESISKAFSGYCGGTILERPEDLAKKVKNGEIPTDKEIADLLEVLNATDEDLTLLMARTSRYRKIKRNGVCIELYGKKIWFKDENTVFNIGREVYVRYVNGRKFSAWVNRSSCKLDVRSIEKREYIDFRERHSGRSV